MADSLICAFPLMMVPSTGILPPGWTSTVSPTSTSSISTSTISPPRITFATFGAISSRDWIEFLVFANVRFSR